MLRRSMTVLVMAWLLALSPVVAAADETVETTDGRKLLLRSDGIYEFLSRIDPTIMDRALATATEWAQDQTLIAYCFRDRPDRELLAQGFVKDRDEALARLRRGGATEQQVRQVAVTIAEHFRAAAPGGEDQVLTQACAAKEVEKNVFIFGGVGRLFFQRPPFNQLK